MEAHALVKRHRAQAKLWLVHASCLLFILDAAGTLLLVAVRQEAFFGACGKVGAVLGTLACYLED